ncbi:MAG: DUF2764 family protein [Ruminococcaceae bacterium]|nr:DUF2764 family protein [Oscillospiraceae bacterium]
MAEYYLISQLPSLDGISENTPIPITEEALLELCSRFLGKKALSELENLTLVPQIDSAKSNSSLIEAWNTGERELRLALGKARAERMNKPFDLQNKNLPTELIKTANTAVEIENPLEAENFLLRYRLNFLETLRPMDSFSEDYIFYYALKLKLILRIRQFDVALGEATYKDIYNSILNGEKVEA